MANRNFKTLRLCICCKNANTTKIEAIVFNNLFTQLHEEDIMKILFHIVTDNTTN